MRSLTSLSRAIVRCRKCRLGYLRRKAVPGEGPLRARIFFVGEAPGRDEDLTGRPFVGAAGKILTKAVEHAGLQRKDVFITSVSKCRPPSNRKPRPDEVAACRPYLVEQIDAVRPKVIVALGQQSIACLVGIRTGIPEARKRMSVYHGIPLLCTYHPAAALYNRPLQSTILKDIGSATRLAGKSKPRRGGIGPIPGKRSEIRTSSGGVPWDGHSRFLLIRRRDEGIWVFPKGTIEKGERSEQTALREVKEEAGLEGKIVSDLGKVSYSFYDPERDANCKKSVDYFLVKVRSRTVELEADFEDYRWCTHAEAAKLVHYANDNEVLGRARNEARKLA